MGENWRLLEWHFPKILINGEAVEELMVEVRLEVNFTAITIAGKTKSRVWIFGRHQVSGCKIVVCLL